MKALLQFDFFGAPVVLASALRSGMRSLRNVKRRFFFNPRQLDLFSSISKLGQRGVNKLKAGAALLLIASRQRVTYRFRYGCRFFFEDDGGYLHAVNLDTLRQTLVMAGAA